MHTGMEAGKPTPRGIAPTMGMTIGMHHWPRTRWHAESGMMWMILMSIWRHHLALLIQKVTLMLLSRLLTLNVAIIVSQRKLSKK